MKVNKQMFDPQCPPVYSAPEVLMLLSCEGTGVCEESRFNSVDDTEYFVEGSEYEL